MSDQDDDSDKSLDATAEKLLEARRKGEVAKSTDLLTAAGYAGLFVALSYAGQDSIQKLTTALIVLIDQAPQLVDIFFEGSAFTASGGLLNVIFLSMLPIFALPALCVVAAIFVQRALVFAPTKLVPKLSRISLISNAKNKFGRNGLFEFAKSFVKLCIYSACLALFIYTRLTEMISVTRTNPRMAISLMVEISLSFLLITILVSGSIGAIDALWQHFEHLRKNKMSRKEVQDEQKNSEGDPHLKQERRQRAMLVSQNQMMADVPTADVIIVNPTHFAVALKWSRLHGEAPVCVAKGVDEIAKAIRLAAAESKVPIHSDPPTARALFATTDIGEMIAPDHFPAVAAAIRFAEAMRIKAKARG